MSRIRIGFYGAGRRMQDFYLPVINSHPQLAFEPVGFVTRTDKTAGQATAATGLKRFPYVGEMAKEVDLIIVCVNAEGMVECSMDALRTDKAVLLETPVTSEDVVRLANSRVPITGVAEQWPFRPMEQFRRAIIKTGTMGKLNVIQNSLRGYEYHAMAMMRAYTRKFDRASMPAVLQGMSWSNGPVNLIDGNGIHKTLVENWDVGAIRLVDNVRLIHNFNSVHSRSQARGPRSLNIYCERGALCADDCNDIHFVESIDGQAVTVDVSVLKDEDTNAPHTLRCSISGEVHEWVNPYREAKNLDEQEVAIMTVLDGMVDAILDNKAVPYPVGDAFVDWLCVMGLRQASAQEKTLVFPNLDHLFR